MAGRPNVRRCDLVTVQDLGNAIDLVAFDGGVEVARVQLRPLAAIGVARQLIEAGHNHLARAMNTPAPPAPPRQRPEPSAPFRKP